MTSIPTTAGAEMDQWIPCSERMPTCQVETFYGGQASPVVAVLWADPTTKYPSTSTAIVVHYEDHYVWMWIDEDGSADRMSESEYPTHWFPLPPFTALAALRAVLLPKAPEKIP